MNAAQPPFVARVLGGLAFVLLAASFVLPFLAFGGRGLAWVVVLSSAGVAAAAGLLAVGDLLAGGAARGRAPIVAGPTALLLVAVAAAGLVPLPAPVVERLSPRRAATMAAVPADLASWPEAEGPKARTMAELLAEEPAPPTPAAAAPAARAEGRFTTSHDPGRTRFALAVLAAWLAALLALASRRDELFGLRLLAVVLPVVALGAVLGLVQQRLGVTKVYGLFAPPPDTPHVPYATFFSPNHFSGLCAMLLPVLVGSILCIRIGWILRLAALALLVPTSLAVLDAGSRGGLLAGAAGAVVLAVFLLRTRGRRLVGLALALFAVLGVGLAFTVFAERLIHETFAETTTLRESNALRAEYYRAQGRMVADAPAVGIGLGAFPVAHQVYKQTEESAAPHHGESDWCEATAELGLPGAALWIALVLALLAPPAVLALSGRAPPLLSGLVAGAAATLLHSAVDFHQREPAVAFVTLLLACTACAWARHERVETAGGEKRASGFGPFLRLAGACAALAGLALVGPRDAAFHVRLDEADRALASGDLDGLERAARAATDARPDRADGWAMQAVAFELRSRPRGPNRAAHRKAALEASVRALELAPASLGVARRAGSVLLAEGALDQAEEAVRLALVVSPASSPTRQLAGEVALVRGRHAEALDHLAFAWLGVPPPELALHAQRFARLLDEASEGDVARLMAIIPAAQHRTFLLFALARAGKDEEFQRALGLLAGEGLPAEPEQLASLLSLGRSEGAARLARTLLPGLEAARSRAWAGVALAASGAREEAVPVLRSVVGAPGVPPEAYLALGDADEAAARHPEALAAWQAGLAAHPQDAVLMRRLKGGGPAASAP